MVTGSFPPPSHPPPRARGAEGPPRIECTSVGASVLTLGAEPFPRSGVGLPGRPSFEEKTLGPEKGETWSKSHSLLVAKPAAELSPAGPAVSLVTGEHRRQRKLDWALGSLGVVQAQERPPRPHRTPSPASPVSWVLGSGLPRTMGHDEDCPLSFVSSGRDVQRPANTRPSHAPSCVDGDPEQGEE